MQHRQKLVTYAFVILLFNFLTYRLCSSQALMKLIPPLKEISVQKGRTGNFEFTIMNTGDNNVPSHFTVHDFDISPDGRPFISDSSKIHSCKEWILLETEDCIINAHKSLKLQGKITVPRSAEGSYYAIIKGSFIGTTIHLGDDNSKKHKPEISLKSDAIVVLLLTIPSSRNKAEIVPDTLIIFPQGHQKSLSSTTNLYNLDNTGWNAIFTLKNIGNIHTRVSGNISFWSESGGKIESASFLVGRGYVIPGKKRNFHANGNKILSDGYYMVRISLNQDDNTVISNSFPFAIYKGNVYPGAITDKLANLIKISSPGFILKQPFIRKKITPGGKTYIPIQLINIINDTLRLIPLKYEWNMDNNGKSILDMNPSIQPRSSSKWINILDNKIIVPPQKSKIAKLKLEVPNNIAGEYYSAIVLRNESINTDIPDEFLPNSTQLLALTTNRNLISDIQIDSVVIKNIKREKISLLKFAFKTKNVGNIHCFISGKMSFEKEVTKGIYKQHGIPLDFGNKETYLLPGNRRIFKFEIPKFKQGTYRIILAVSFDVNQQPKVKYQTFNVNK